MPEQDEKLTIMHMAKWMIDKFEENWEIRKIDVVIETRQNEKLWEKRSLFETDVFWKPCWRSNGNF